jgi:hypothetical protein
LLCFAVTLIQIHMQILLDCWLRFLRLIEFACPANLLLRSPGTLC